MDFIAWYKAPGRGELSFTRGEAVRSVMGLDSYPYEMAPAGPGVCPGVQGDARGGRNACVQASAPTHETWKDFLRTCSHSGFPSGSWSEHAPFHVPCRAPSGLSGPRKVIHTCISAGPSPLAHVVGRRWTRGQRDLAKTRRS